MTLDEKSVHNISVRIRIRECRFFAPLPPHPANFRQQAKTLMFRALKTVALFGVPLSLHSSRRSEAAAACVGFPRPPPRPLQSLTLCISRSVQSPIDRIRVSIVALFSEDRSNLPVADVFRRIFIVERCCFLFCSSLDCELAVFMV